MVKARHGSWDGRPQAMRKVSAVFVWVFRTTRPSPCWIASVPAPAWTKGAMRVRDDYRHPVLPLQTRDQRLKAAMGQGRLPGRGIDPDGSNWDGGLGQSSSRFWIGPSQLDGPRTARAGQEAFESKDQSWLVRGTSASDRPVRHKVMWHLHEPPSRHRMHPQAHLRPPTHPTNTTMFRKLLVVVAMAVAVSANSNNNTPHKSHTSSTSNHPSPCAIRIYMCVFLIIFLNDLKQPRAT